jgi:hypothetical protein
MIDAAVWCDFFSQRTWSYEKVAKALAYLFKVPEGAAKGVDPGFFRQMEELKTEVLEAAGGNNKSHSKAIATQVLQQQQQQRQPTRNHIAFDSVVAEWTIPGDARIICAGLGSYLIYLVP